MTTKHDMIVAMAEAAGTSKAQSEANLNAFIELVGTSLKESGELKLAGLGNFALKHNEAKVGRNPATGAPIDIPAKNVVKFRPAKALTEKIN